MNSKQRRNGCACDAVLEDSSKKMSKHYHRQRKQQSMCVCVVHHGALVRVYREERVRLAGASACGLGAIEGAADPWREGGGGGSIQPKKT